MVWKKFDKQKGSNFSHIYAHNGWSNAKERIPNFVENDLQMRHSNAGSVSIVQTENKITSLDHLYDDIGASLLIAGFNMSYAHE
jgi:hypothetical protein